MEDKNNIIVLTLLIAVSLVLLALNNLDSVKLIKNIGIRFLSPVGLSAEYPIRKTGKLYERIQALTKCIEQNSSLRKENKKLKKEYRDLDFMKKLHNELSSSINTPEFNPGRLLPVQILFHPPDRYFSELTISAGAGAGIKKDMVVVSIREGHWVIQGRIDEVLPDYSRVRLITSPEFRAAVRLPGGYSGVIQGNDGWSLTLKYIAPNAPLSEGDEIYTSGTGGILPEGLFVGKIKAVKELEFSIGKEGTVELFAYPHNRGYLYVVK